MYDNAAEMSSKVVLCTFAISVCVCDMLDTIVRMHRRRSSVRCPGLPSTLGRRLRMLPKMTYLHLELVLDKLVRRLVHYGSRNFPSTLRYCPGLDCSEAARASMC